LADADLAADLLLALRNEDIHLEQISVQKPSLDEAFLALTGHAANTADAGNDENAQNSQNIPSDVEQNDSERIAERTNA
jgi:ABC-2 type transport system ATP-binding protein